MQSPVAVIDGGRVFEPDDHDVSRQQVEVEEQQRLPLGHVREGHLDETDCLAQRSRNIPNEGYGLHDGQSCDA